MSEEQLAKWTFNYGIHRGTYTSRDTGSNQYDTEEEAMKFYHEQKKWLKSIGYMFWYADLIAPDGAKKRLEQNPYW